MTQTLGVGIIGCGNIASQYLGLAPLFKGIEIIACADINPAAAEERANEFKIRSMSVDELLGSDEIDIVVNLTIPAVHASVSADILNAGKHVYSEKPFALTQQETTILLNLANKHGLRIGSAPDTFLGGVHQHARDLIDSGALGTINSGTAHVQSRGMESWHPNPDFFFKPGA
ncbi:MAG: Gfo/Idh/MocA family oxidoreductase, partial [Granulosicoccus sp.]|nr:Gfo/Idh/MocA family oxidoreductase [Granulosicoccus sp.]